MAGHRRGTYLTDTELDALEQLAEGSGLTGSSVLRIGLRRLAGLPVPRRELEAVAAASSSSTAAVAPRVAY